MDRLHADSLNEDCGGRRPTSYNRATKGEFCDIIDYTQSSGFNHGLNKSVFTLGNNTEGINDEAKESTDSAPYAYTQNLQKDMENKYEKCCDMHCSSDNTKPNILARTGSYNSTGSECSLLSRTSETIRENRCFFVFICVFIVISMTSMILSIVLFVKLSSLNENFEDERSERKTESNTFCLPCNDLIQGPLDEDNDDLEQLVKQEKNGIQECCAKGANKTSILVALLFRRREKLNQAQEIIDSETNCKCNSTSHTNSGQSNAIKRSAHLLAGVQSSTDGQSNTLHNWITSGPIAHSKDIQVRGSHIIIDTSGLYFVYSQIFFTNLYKGQTGNNASQSLYHYVYRWNIIYPNDGNELLLKSVRTQCWAENRVYGDYTSYTSGVFKLNAGDNLFVKTSNIGLISRDQRASFFGITEL